MPKKICTICVSYLKHAIIFRKQTIENIKWLKDNYHQLTVLSSSAAANIQSNNENKFNEKHLMQNDMENFMKQQKFFNYDGTEQNVAVDCETFDSLQQEMAYGYGGGACSDTDDDEDNTEPGASVLFNYKEKNFQEDDILDFDITSKITVNVPDEMRERKCEACRKRFMLKDTFEQHLKECIELKLMNFINDGSQLLNMRKSRTLSASEFVRRTIFSLKKTVKLLALCYKEVSDGPTPQCITMGDDKLTKKINLLELGDIEKFHIGPMQQQQQQQQLAQQSQQKKRINNNVNHINNLSSSPLLSNDVAKEKCSLNILEGNPHIFVQKNNFNSHQRTSTPQNFSFENKHSSTIIGADSALPNVKSKNTSLFKNTFSTDENAAQMDCVDEVTLVMRNSNQKGRAPHSNDILQINETVIAQCSPPCSKSFTSLREFEDHIRQDHNDSVAKMTDTDNTNTSTDERNKFMQMLASSSVKF